MKKRNPKSDAKDKAVEMEWKIYTHKAKKKSEVDAYLRATKAYGGDVTEAKKYVQRNRKRK